MNFYYCDPDKNVWCKKLDCYKNGGRCSLTSDIRYSTDCRCLEQDEGWSRGNYRRGPLKHRKFKGYDMSLLNSQPSENK